MKRRYKIVIWVAAAIWLAVFIATAPEWVTALEQRRVVETAFDSYSSAILRRDWETAYAQGGTEFHAAISLQAFVASLSGLQQKYGDLRSVKEKGLEVRVYRSPARRIARVTADHEYERRTIRFVYEFHFEQGRWALFGFEQQ